MYICFSGHRANDILEVMASFGHLLDTPLQWSRDIFHGRIYGALATAPYLMNNLSRPTIKVSK